MRRTIIAMCLALLVVPLACSDDDPSGPPPTATISSAPDVSAADLAGKTFVGTSVEGFELVEGSEIQISFEETTLSATAGCNTLGATYAIEGDTLTTSDASTTLMACSDPLMAQDQWLADLVGSGVTVALGGSTLTLTGEEATVTLEEGSS